MGLQELEKMINTYLNDIVSFGEEDEYDNEYNNEQIYPLVIPQYDESNPYPIEKANNDKNKDITAIDSALAYTPVEVTIGKNITLL